MLLLVVGPNCEAGASRIPKQECCVQTVMFSSGGDGDKHGYYFCVILVALGDYACLGDR
jgi:hypothetical protein